MDRRKDNCESAVRDIETWYRAIIDSATDFAIVTLNDEGCITSWNHGAERLLGYSEDEVISRPGDLFFTPEDRAAGAPERELQQARLRGRADDERWHMRRDGSRFYGSGVVTPLRHGGFVKIFRDRTREHEAKLSLAAREAEFRTLADTMPQMVWSTKPHGSADYVNARWHEFTGAHSGATDGDVWTPLIHPEDRECVSASWRQSVATGEPYEVEYRLRRRDGAYRWVLGRAQPLRDEQGQILRWFGTCTDIDDVRRAQELMRDADRRKDAFLATLAHELRNPLAPLRTSAHVLAREGLQPAQVRSAAAVIVRQVAQMARLLDDLLDIARVSSGKLQLRPERVTLRAVIDNAVETAHPLIESKGHRLQVRLPSVSPTLLVDPVRLAQVLSNLLINAAKYTDPGGRIEVLAETAGAEVRIAVNDTGMGFSPGVADELFEMFVQARRGLIRSDGGLGIGLALARNIVQLHGGSIDAQSDGPGRGSTFTIRLPLATAVEPRARH
jgi:PAS domain S-box